MVDEVRAWRPDVPGIREVLHARFDTHSYPAHTHDDWTVLLITEGAVRYDLDRRDHLAESTTLTLLPPGVPHDGRSAIEGRGFRKRVLYLESGWMGERAPSRAARQPTLPGGRIVALAAGIHEALLHRGDELAAESAVLALGHAALEALGDPVGDLRDSPLAHRLRDLLDDTLFEAFTLAEAGSRLGAHPGHLARVFAQTYGLPPHRYVIGRRVDHARRLLTTGHSAAASAVASGFHDQAHMTRHFRKVLGVTPGTFGTAR